MFKSLFEYLMNTSVEENLEVHDSLNPKLWNEDQTLKKEIKDKIELIVGTFLKILDEDEIPTDIEDIQLTGSNANYNYTDNSDIDIHIMMNIDKDPQNYLNKIYNSYKTLFNNRYTITLKGIPVEIYVEDANDATRKAHGIYSVVNDEWIAEPAMEEIPEINEEELNKRVKYWEGRYSKLLNQIDSEEKDLQEYIKDIDNYIDELYEVRQHGLLRGGEYSLQNQVFKEIRNKDILDDLRNKKIELINSLLSLK